MAKILLVDDDLALRSTLRRILLRANHEVVEAEDGTQAVLAARGRSPDLVITDLIMPNKEGMEIMIEFKKEQPRIPVIVMSGGGRLDARDYLQMATRMGAARTLAKPFGAQELLSAVDEVLKAPA